MKKILAFLMTICMLAGAFTITAFAEDPVVLSIGAIKNDGYQTHLSSYTDFVEGWSAAMELADKKDSGYRRIIVDFKADWTADEKGVFSKSGKGFWHETLYIEDGVKMTINLNGHTINRNLQDWTDDGEVIYIDTGADVEINAGTITGGWSCNGAGGIHINDDAVVTLTRVNVVGNKVTDDDGGGIAVYDDAVLKMTQGCVSNNRLIKDYISNCYGGGVYVEDSTAFFYEVNFENNVNVGGDGYGVAVYSKDSRVYFEDCTFKDNGLTDEIIGATEADSIVYLYASEASFTECFFDGNGTRIDDLNTVITIQAAKLLLEKCNFKDNRQTYLLFCTNSGLSPANMEAYDTNFTGNVALSYISSSTCKGTFYNCSFERGVPNSRYNCTFDNSEKTSLNYTNLYLYDCTLGGATFLSKRNVEVKNLKTGSIFGEGSLTMVVAILALVASAASIGVTMSLKKRLELANVAPAKAEDDE